MFNAKVTLVNIVNRVLNTYNTNEGWVVKKMKLKYANRLLPFSPLSTKKIRCNILIISLP
jgi:hypothetical protein